MIIAHDMTRTERDECKRLVEEAKARMAQDTSGEFLYRVRGSPGDLKIVKIKKKKLNLQVLYTNADGLLNKKCELNLLINYLDVKPDIIAITEI